MLRYLILILLLATPAYAVDTALVDRDGVTTAADTVSLVGAAISASPTISTAQSATNPDSLVLRQKQGFTGTVTTTVDNTGSFTPYVNVWPQTQPSGVLKMSSGVYGSAVAGTDYAPATSGTGPLKGNGAGGFSNASATDIFGLWSGTKSSAYCLSGDGTMQPVGTGTVTAVSVASANGITGSSSGGATPALTISLGAIAPSSVTASGAVAGKTLEVDGHATAALTAAQVSNTTVYNTGQTAADVALTLPAAAVGLAAYFTVGTAQSNKWGVRAAAGDKIYLLAADGTISAGADNGYARMTAAQVGQSFACWTFKTDNYDWMCKAVAIGTSTFAAN